MSRSLQLIWYFYLHILLVFVNKSTLPEVLGEGWKELCFLDVELTSLRIYQEVFVKYTLWRTTIYRWKNPLHGNPALRVYLDAPQEHFYRIWSIKALSNLNQYPRFFLSSWCTLIPAQIEERTLLLQTDILKVLLNREPACWI